MTSGFVGRLMWSAETWTAAGTWATALIAAVAAVFAYRQVRESRRLREAQAQPFVVVTLEPSDITSHLINLRVENIGQTLARDVTFTFDPPLRSKLEDRDEGYGLNQGRLVKEGISSMPPGMRIERIFDDAQLWEADDGYPRAFDVEVRFKGHDGKPQAPLTYRVDLRPYLDGTYVEARTVHDVAKELREIRTAMKKWAEGSQGLKVWVRDGEQKDRRQSERLVETRGRLLQQASEVKGSDSERGAGGAGVAS